MNETQISQVNSMSHHSVCLMCDVSHLKRERYAINVILYFNCFAMPSNEIDKQTNEQKKTEAKMKKKHTHESH